MPYRKDAKRDTASHSALDSFNLGSLNIAITGVRKLGASTSYTLEGASGGAGSIAIREIFPGMRLLLADVRDLPQNAVVALGHFWRAWCLLHCQQGDCSVHASDGTTVQVSDGEVAFLSGQGQGIAFHVHEGRLRGMALVVDDAALTRDVLTVMRSFFGIDSQAVRQRLGQGQVARALDDSLDALHVFTELYFAFAHADSSYLRLKSFELLAIYTRALDDGADEPRKRKRSRAGSDLRHAAIAMRAQEIMTSELSHPHTISELAKECATSTTVLKESFREVFGMPVYSWLRATRMQRACEIMEADPSRSIASVGAEVGYSNASKFAKAFADTMGMTPSAFKRSL